MATDPDGHWLIGVAALPNREPEESMRRTIDDRGAAAVELALVLPVLMLLVMGIVQFGLAFNRQISLSGGAREGARWLAIHSADSTGAVSHTIAAGPVSPVLTSGDVSVCAGPAGATCVTNAVCASGLT